MRMLLLGLCALFEISGLIACIIIWIDAFQDEWWKGLLGVFCFFYLIYYGLCEFEHDYKWPIVCTALGGHGVALACFSMIR